MATKNTTKTAKPAAAPVAEAAPKRKRVVRSRAEIDQANFDKELANIEKIDKKLAKEHDLLARVEQLVAKKLEPAKESIARLNRERHVAQLRLEAAALAAGIELGAETIGEVEVSAEEAAVLTEGSDEPVIVKDAGPEAFDL